MRAAVIVGTLFAASAVVAAPVVKRDLEEILVTEVEWVDQEGDVLSVSYFTETTDLGAGAAPSAPPAPVVPPVNPSPAPASPSVAPAAAPSVAPPPAAVPSVTPAAVSVPAVPSPPAATPSPDAPAAPATGAQAVSSYISSNANGQNTADGWIDPSDPRFADISVYHHNIHRTNHTVGPVVWNQTMADMAASWAATCNGEEVVPAGSGLGMNVAFSSSADGYNPSMPITGSWYNSELEQFPAYGVGTLPVGDGTDFNNWGHFTQVVWPNVTQIGCGVYTQCGGAFSVHFGCYYYIEGNIQGEFNVVNPPVNGEVVYPNGMSSM